MCENKPYCLGCQDEILKLDSQADTNFGKFFEVRPPMG